MPGTRTPRPRGPLSAQLLEVLTGSTRPGPEFVAAARRALATCGGRVLDDDDVQCTLWLAYELHYRGLEGVDDVWEWDAHLIEARGVLEAAMEARLREAVAPAVRSAVAGAQDHGVVEHLLALLAQDDGPPLASAIARTATVDQFREFLTHRSIYHLKEADPHTWAIPRLAGSVKAALVEIQSDEYGEGRPERMHAALFARAMREAGLDDTYGAYLDAVPAATLAWANTMSLFGLQRRLRGAVVGHLAALESTSSLPNARYARGVRRLDLPVPTAWFFDEHVEADAVHEQIAVRDLAGGLVAAEPELAADVLFGAAAALHTDAVVGGLLLEAWSRGASSLRSATSGYRLTSHASGERSVFGREVSRNAGDVAARLAQGAAVP